MTQLNKFDLLAIEPQKVSKDITSYTQMIYGPPKSGKTTFLHKLFGKNAIFIRTEKGTKTLAGLFGIDVGSWTDFQMVRQQLRKKEVQERYKVVVIDTIDNLWLFLETFVKQKYNVEDINKANGGYGKGYKEMSEELFNAFKDIETLGYTLSFISHASKTTEKLPNSKEEFEKYIPSIPKRGLDIVAKMVDSILFSYLTVTPEGQQQRVIYTRETLQWQAGSRFDAIDPVILLDADAYKEALFRAIESIGEENLKEERETNYITSSTDQNDFETLMNEAKQIGLYMHNLNRMAEVNAIVEKYFGEGAKLTYATPEQIESLTLAVEELRTLVQPQQ
jgi:AAA domain